MSRIISNIKKESGRKALDAAARVAHGRVISSRLFRKYLFQIVFVVALLMIYIANRYDCVTGMETIVRLKDECEIAKTELQSQRALYMTSVRESAIQHKADSLKLGLAVQQQPPYKINYTKR